MSSRPFTVVPISGLGNRMRVVASVVGAAAGLPEPVRVVWQAAWDCRAQFDQLFEPIDVPNVRLDAGAAWLRPATKRNLWLPMLVRRLGSYKKEYRCYAPQGGRALLDLIQAEPHTYLNTCYALGPYTSADVRRTFRPLPPLADRIQGVTEHFVPGRTLGIHIRRTDNRQAIAHSPLSAFCRRIDEAIAAGQAEAVFLCTDDDLVRQHLRQRYGSRLVSLQPNLARHALQGIRDAVVDLWSLAKADHILGSYYSSFSETAAELGDATLEIIRQ